MLKRLLYALPAAVFIAASASLTTLAAPAGDYEFPDLDLEITVPEGLTVFLRDSADTDPDAAALGLDGKKILESMERGNLCIDAVAPEAAWEITFGAEESVDGSSLFDLNLYGDDYLNQLGADLRDRFARSGVEQTAFEIRQGEQARFLITDTVQGRKRTPIYRRQYYTVYNGRIYTLLLISAEKEITAEAAAALDSMAESIRFTRTLPVPEKVAEHVRKIEEEGEVPNDVLNTDTESGGFLFVILGIALFALAIILGKKKVAEDASIAKKAKMNLKKKE